MPSVRIAAPVGAALAAVAILSAILARRRTRRPDDTWRCVCGQAYRVNGEGRHRVYWLAGAPPSEPVLAADCPSCERPLPR